MNQALSHFSAHFASLGYRHDAVIPDYRFSDLGDAGTNFARTVPMAVFTQTPASYRTAAFGVVEAKGASPEAVVIENASLGAPVFFVIEGTEVTQWQVIATERPRFLGVAHRDSIASLFRGSAAQWGPDAIHRAKSIGRFEASYQLSFVDIGLLPAIEGQIHTKLDQLLSEAIAESDVRTDSLDARMLFQGVFRLLSAKVLIDRNHGAAKGWNVEDVNELLDGIGKFYSLPGTISFPRKFGNLEGVWKVLRRGLSVANISADDLAYVYENTLVTPETRRDFGTHSTPRHVADYIVSRLGLWNAAPNLPSVYEPFCGAGVFLVAALRQMRDSLPHSWSDADRHNLLVQKIAGDEQDTFACEVATLSLILADYPNTNGWQIETHDLFDGNRLISRLQKADIVLCNPPFEAFTPAQKKSYPSTAGLGGNKAEVALQLALLAKPEAIGFVLPQAFLQDKAYKNQRDAIAADFSEVELVSLPDGVFNVSKVESALLIAKGRRLARGHQLVRRAVVLDRDRNKFRETGEPSSVKEVERTPDQVTGQGLWILRSQSVWDELKHLDCLGNHVEAHWGVRWKDKYQKLAASGLYDDCSVKGIALAKNLRQYSLPEATNLDVNPDKLYGGGKLPWDQPKVLMNAARKARGAWKFAAAVDRSGLWASQQYAGLWRRQDADIDLDLVAAIINSPFGNAYLAEHNTDRRIRLGSLHSIPLPQKVPGSLSGLIQNYNAAVTNFHRELLGSELLQSMLDAIDQLILEAYDLSPRAVRCILSGFAGDERPTVHSWEPLRVEEDDPALSISEVRSAAYAFSKKNWLTADFMKVPNEQLIEVFSEIE